MVYRPEGRIDKYIQKEEKIMAYCAKCGTQMEEGQKFCDACGAPAEGGEQQQAGGTDAFEQFTNTTDETSAYEQQDIAQNKGMAILSYLGFLVLIPIFGAKNSRYAQFHANQGLVLFITEVALGIVMAILKAPFRNGLLGGISLLLGSVHSIASLLLLVLAILGIVNAAQGRAKELPVLGKFRILK